MTVQAKSKSVAHRRTDILAAIERAIRECGMDQLWHWGELPNGYSERCLLPSDLPTETPKWSAISTLAGYWLAPGPLRQIQQIGLFGPTLRHFPEIKANITTQPVQCQIQLGGQIEQFFGESWTLKFSDLPIIQEALPPDHPLEGLNAKFDDPSTLAILANQRAAELKNKKAPGVCDLALNQLYSEQAQAEAERLVEIGERKVIEGAGEKIVELENIDVFGFEDTLEHPNMISVRAAGDRLNLARGAGVLQSGLDASVTVDAKDSLTKMLAHQLAASHRGSMKMIQQGLAHGVPHLEAARCLATAARLMMAFQSGVDVLHRMKHGNRQTMIVKHVQVVQVGEGGQAMVAGNVRAKGKK